MQFAVSGFRCGREHIEKLSELAHDPEYAKSPDTRACPCFALFRRVASEADPGLERSALGSSPICRQGLVLSGIDRCEAIPEEHERRQRVYWLAAGVIVSPGVYGDLLERDSQKVERAGFGTWRHSCPLEVP